MASDENPAENKALNEWYHGHEHAPVPPGCESDVRRLIDEFNELRGRGPENGGLSQSTNAMQRWNMMFLAIGLVLLAVMTAAQVATYQVIATAVERMYRLETNQEIIIRELYRFTGEPTKRPGDAPRK